MFAASCGFGQVDLVGPCNGFGDLSGRRMEAVPLIVVSSSDPKIHCGDEGGNKERQKKIIAWDLTRPWPMARRI